MAFNIFEGARRISLLLAVGAAVITVLAAYNNEPYISKECSSAVANRATENNDISDEDAIAYLNAKKELADNDIKATGNITDEEFERRLNAKIVTGQIKIRPPAKKILTDKEMIELEKETCLKKSSEKWHSQFAEAMRYLIAGLIGFAAFVWAVGWIVRGFFGIPRGMDKRPD